MPAEPRCPGCVFLLNPGFWGCLSARERPCPGLAAFQHRACRVCGCRRPGSGGRQTGRQERAGRRCGGSDQCRDLGGEPSELSAGNRAPGWELRVMHQPERTGRQGPGALTAARIGAEEKAGEGQPGSAGRLLPEQSAWAPQRPKPPTRPQPQGSWTAGCNRTGGVGCRRRAAGVGKPGSRPTSPGKGGSERLQGLGPLASESPPFHTLSFVSALLMCLFSFMRYRLSVKGHNHIKE